MKDKLVALLGRDNVLANEAMKKHTTFQIGGKVDYFVTPTTKDAFASVISYCYNNKIPYMVLGEGSNLLVSDKGIEGLVISTKKMTHVTKDDTTLVAEAGITMKDLNQFAKDEALSGLEFSCGIPGSLGGAIYMNAGAYDGEIKNVVKRVELVDEAGKRFFLANDELDFSYRHSLLQEKPYYCLSVEIALEKRPKEAIEEKIAELTDKREAKQPLELPSAGSTFKRPEGYFAGKLIIEAGMQGVRVGGAEVSTKHAGFIVNVGNASAKDVLELIERVREAVHKESGVWLEPEVRLTGRAMDK